MIDRKISSLQNNIGSICNSCGRSPGDIRSILVTKTVDVERIRSAYAAGVRHFGENKAQELVSKYTELPTDIMWHFIGHLQTNKVKDIISKVCLIHSLDSLRLAKEINKQSARIGRRTRCLVQVNTSGEQSKFGMAPEHVASFLHEVQQFECIEVQGLMTIGPCTDDPAHIRASFRELHDLCFQMQSQFSDLKLVELSMGMSADYPIAIEEGATFVRIGSLVFGERDYSHDT
jgi:PLP dependent protein